MNQIPLVSISCITYNHAPYIRQCLDGFMMQQTNFAFEVLIHDDASTDGTTEIIKEYEKKYPDIIKPIYEEENQWVKGRKGSALFNFPRAKGKYIAMCEGDDYWTDPLKLQKQVDFLESNPDFSICSHSYFEYNQTNDQLYEGWQPAQNIQYDINDLLGGMWYHHTLTVVFRKSCLDLSIYQKYPKSMDAVLFYHLLRSSKGFLLKENMAVYRKHDDGVWSNVGLDKQREDEFLARLGICSVDQDSRSAQFLKTQFYKTMSRRWMKDNTPIIIRSLRIIYYHLGLWTALKSIVKAIVISVR